MVSFGSGCAGSCSDCQACDGITKSVYVRVEYFEFDEFNGGVVEDSDTGVVPTIGFFRRRGRHRVRLECFASRLSFKVLVPFFGTYLHSHTSYVGGRAEYDYFLFPNSQSRREWLVGIGTRLWDRNVDSIGGSDVDEFWLTLYPYFGVESRRDLSKPVEFFYRGRLGLTAFTYERVSLSSGFQADAYPMVDPTMLTEFGFRSDRGFISGYFELFTWRAVVPSGRCYSIPRASISWPESKAACFSSGQTMPRRGGTLEIGAGK